MALYREFGCMIGKAFCCCKVRICKNDMNIQKKQSTEYAAMTAPKPSGYLSAFCTNTLPFIDAPLDTVAGTGIGRSEQVSDSRPRTTL